MTDRRAPQVAVIKLGDEIGDTGLRRYSGYVREEFLRQLTGRRGVEVFREMRDNDPVIGAMMFGIEQVLRNVEWEVKSSSDAAESKRWAEFLDECFEDMDRAWAEIVTEILTFLTYGWGLHEIVYKYRYEDSGSKFNDGRIGWSKLPSRSQSTLMSWEFTPHGKPTQFTQIPWVGGGVRTIPLEKCILFRTTTALDNPEGRSILRNAYVPWYYKKRISEIEAIGIERDLAGMPVMRVPAEIMSEDAEPAERALYANLQTIVRNVKRNEDEGIILPSDADEKGQPLYDLKLLSTAGNRQFDTNEIINRYDLRIAQSVLADFILLGHEKVGSFALSDNKTDMFAVALNGFLRMIETAMNEQAIPRLMKLNGVPPEFWPKMQAGDTESRSVREVGEYLERITSVGIIQPDEDLEKWARNLVGAPDKGKLLQPIQGEGEPQNQPGQEGDEEDAV